MSETTWWEHPATDWTRDEPNRALQLLARAYDERDAIKLVVRSAGLDWSMAPSAPASARATWVWALEHAARTGRVLDLMAEVLQDPSVAAFRPRLRMLLGERLGATDARRVLRYGMPASDPEATQVLESLTAIPAEPGDVPVRGLQAITAVTAGFGDPQAYLQAVIDAVRRVAMIEIGGRPAGTGLLVGPDLLLTAAHVMAARNWQPGTAGDAVAVFDYFDTGRNPAETGTRVPVIDHVTSLLPSPAESTGVGRDWEASREHLDFALLRLAPVAPYTDARSETSSRGFYPLHRQPYALSNTALLLILQHPLGEFQTMSYVRGPFQTNGAGTRIRYQGNTLQGSSGSPVIDLRGRLVALHHYSTGVRNQAVPISPIADTLLGGPHGDLFAPAAHTSEPAGVVTPPSGGTDNGGGGAGVPSRYDPYVTMEVVGRPFVNRAGLRRSLQAMARDDGRRTLIISGASGSGVTYSYNLMAHIASRSRRHRELTEVAPGGLAAFAIDLGRYTNHRQDERRIAMVGDICIGFGLRTPEEPIAQEARNISSFQLWLTRELQESDRQWWVFVDSIDDESAVKVGDVHELVHALVTMAQDPQVPVRVVLAGRKALEVAGAHADWAEQDIAEGLLRPEVERWIRERADEDGRAINEDKLSDELAKLFPEGSHPPADSVAPRLPRILLDVVEGGR